MQGSSRVLFASSERLNLEYILDHGISRDPGITLNWNYRRLSFTCHWKIYIVHCQMKYSSASYIQNLLYLVIKMRRN